MLRTIILLLAYMGGFFTVFSAGAIGLCKFEGGDYLNLAVPQMSIPADTPDGTILYSSPKMMKKVNCENTTYFANPGNVVAITTADFNEFLNKRNGIKFSLFINDVKFERGTSLVLGQLPAGWNTKFNKDIYVWFDVKVDSSMGKIPVSGTYLSGGYESVYVMSEGSYSSRRGVISIQTPDITFIPCVMDISVTPDTIDFNKISVSDLDKGIKIKRSFSTLIQKSKGCTSNSSSSFSLNMFFEPVNPVINADGSLSLNNGLGLSVLESNGTAVAYNSALKVDNIKVGSILKKDFTASLQKISGQDIKTGPFSADVVVRLNYY